MKHLKCFGLFLAICAGFVVLMAVSIGAAFLAMLVLGPNGSLIAAILALMVIALLLAYEHCKDWR